jgi:hypothetical protein
VDAVTRHHAIHGDAGLLIMQMATRYSVPTCHRHKHPRFQW